MSPLAAPAAPRTKKAPRRMTERRLENIATYYLERFSTTAAHLRTVLMRRVDRSLKAEGSASRSDMAAWVDTVVARLVASGAVNDSAYAEGRTARMRRLGKGPGRIRAALIAKGISAAEADRVIAATAEAADGSDASLNAAIAYLRRRRLGPFRTGARDADTDRRDLGALARAGFSRDVAQAALRTEPA
jgi:regulatory protein